MVATAEIESALTWLLGPVGPESNAYSDRTDRWNLWLDTLTGDDLPKVVSLAIAHVRRVGFADPSDQYLAALLECIEVSANHDAQRYLAYADAAISDADTRPLYIMTAGRVYWEEVIIWMSELYKRCRLSAVELQMLAHSLHESKSSTAVQALGHLATYVRDTNPILSEEIDNLQLSLAKSVENSAGKNY